MELGRSLARLDSFLPRYGVSTVLKRLDWTSVTNISGVISVLGLDWIILLFLGHPIYASHG